MRRTSDGALGGRGQPWRPRRSRRQLTSGTTEPPGGHGGYGDDRRSGGRRHDRLQLRQRVRGHLPDRRRTGADPGRVPWLRFVEGSANGDCDQQVRDVENFVAQGVDALVVLPLCGVEPLTPVLEEADAAGIKSSATRPRCRR